MNKQTLILASPIVLTLGAILLWTPRNAEPRSSAPVPDASRTATPAEFYPTVPLAGSTVNDVTDETFFDRIDDRKPLAAPPDDRPTPPVRTLVIMSREASSAQASSAAPPELELTLAPGVREPVALFASMEGLTPAQANALAVASEDFLEKIEAAARSAASDRAVADVWDRAQADADSAYRNIFGDSEFMQKSADAAARALGTQSSDAGSAGTPPSGP